jgi:hypothetical protein
MGNLPVASCIAKLSEITFPDDAQDPRNFMTLPFEVVLRTDGAIPWNAAVRPEFHAWAAPLSQLFGVAVPVFGASARHLSASRSTAFPFDFRSVLGAREGMMLATDARGFTVRDSHAEAETADVILPNVLYWLRKLTVVNFQPPVFGQVTRLIVLG